MARSSRPPVEADPDEARQLLERLATLLGVRVPNHTEAPRPQRTVAPPTLAELQAAYVAARETRDAATTNVLDARSNLAAAQDFYDAAVATFETADTALITATTALFAGLVAAAGG